MDALSLFITITSATIAVLSSAYSFFNRQRYKDNTELYASGNTELRQQNATLREEKTDLVAENAQLRTQVTEKETTIKDLRSLNANLPNYQVIAEKTSEIIKVISDNHTQVMTQLSQLAKRITGKVDGKTRK